jgi:hypothetical protein
MTSERGSPRPTRLSPLPLPQHPTPSSKAGLESTEDVRRAVAEILNGPAPDHAVPGCLAEISLMRSAARRVAEANIDDRDRARLLLRLLEVARGLELAEWARRAICEEFLDPPGPAIPALTRRLAARKLRVAGYESCPVCHSMIATEQQLERWNRLAGDALRDAAVRAGAVSA